MLDLPDGWKQELIEPFGIVITSPDGCSVTVDENLRNFELGIVTVKSRGNYSGRGWRRRLYLDAMSALQGVTTG